MLNQLKLPSHSILPTVIKLSAVNDAGIYSVLSISVVSFPDAATNSISLAAITCFISISCKNSRASDSPPQLQLHIDAPFASAYFIPKIRFDVEASPLESTDLIGIILIFIFDAIPTTPLLSFAAAITPATAVPCPLSSVTLLLPLRDTKFHPLISSL